MKNKKGVSPLVATVLLVAIVIVIAFLIFWWYGELVERKLQKEEVVVEQACMQDVEFSLSLPNCTSGPIANEKIVSFEAENTGNIRLSSFRINAEGDSGSSYNQEISQGIEQGVSVKLSFIINTDEYGEDLYVDVTPMVRAGQTTKHCTEKVNSFSVSC